MIRSVISDNQITRRSFLYSTAGLCTLALLPGCTGVDDGEPLSDLAYALFPHPELTKSTYGDLATSFAKQSPQDAATLTALSSEMSSVGYSQWIETNYNLPELQAYRFSVMIGLYANDETTSVFGYEGPSFEHGGYLDRGFDDLTWLSGPAV